MVTEDNNDDRNVEVCSTDSKEKEVRTLTHGDFLMVKDGKHKGDRCFMVKSAILERQSYFIDEGNVLDTCFSMKTVKTVKEHVTEIRDCLMVKDGNKRGYRCFMVKSASSKSQSYFTDEGNVSDTCFSIKTLKTVNDHVSECEKVIDKVYSILKYIYIPTSLFLI